ncbi:MAG: hypothetical protein MMC23_000097 [Stictis urceolatum]|nr:hypothetical protein [Stictis urceolata]
MASDDRQTVFITGYLLPASHSFTDGLHSQSPRCSSGIGYELAQSFQRCNFRVFATARNASSLSSLAAKGIETLSLTVDDEDSVSACYADLCSRLGPEKGLDYLVHNAGRNYTVPATDISLPEVRQTFATNLFGIMHINATFLPLLIRTHGTIINIGSVAGIIPYIWGSSYNASKAALHSYANTLRVELAPFGIHVITVVTGGVKSNIARTKRVLPEGSIWGDWRGVYERRVSHSQEVGMDTRVYAEKVVEGCLGARGWLWNRNEVWAGTKSSLVWWVSTFDWFWPGGLWTRVMPRLFELASRIEPPEGKKRI